MCKHRVKILQKTFLYCCMFSSTLKLVTSASNEVLCTGTIFMFFLKHGAPITCLISLTKLTVEYAISLHTTTCTSIVL